MAKSQYTDSITGEVLVDIRYIDGRILDLSKYIPSSITNSFKTNNNTKFSAKSIYDSGDIYFTSSPSFTSFTLSWWQNILDRSKAAWYGMWVANIQQVIHLLPSYGNNSCMIGGPKKPWTGEKSVFGNPPNTNTWYHYAAVYNQPTFKFYINGNLQLSLDYNFSGKITQLKFQDITRTDGTCYSMCDDIVLILNQALWTSNFTVPNYLLTGDKEIPNKIRNKQILYPRKQFGDYFDKAIIY